MERERRHRKERGLSSYYPIGTILQRDVGIVYVIDINVIRAYRNQINGHRFIDIGYTYVYIFISLT